VDVFLVVAEPPAPRVVVLALAQVEAAVSEQVARMRQHTGSREMVRRRAQHLVDLHQHARGRSRRRVDRDAHYEVDAPADRGMSWDAADRNRLEFIQEQRKPGSGI